MQQVLSQIETAILLGAVNDLDNLLRCESPVGYGYGAEKLAIREAKELGIVKCAAGRWLGCATDPALRVAISRAYKNLESAGLVERVAANGVRCTHLRPTDAGRELAANLKAENCTTAGARCAAATNNEPEETSDDDDGN
jgi:hypothetical protein